MRRHHTISVWMGTLLSCVIILLGGALAGCDRTGFHPNPGDQVSIPAPDSAVQEIAGDAAQQVGGLPWLNILLLGDERSEWPGGVFAFLVDELQQEPPACFMGQAILDFILVNLGIGETEFPVFLPAESDYPTTLYLNVPFLGVIEIDAYFVNDRIEFDPPVTINDIDVIAIIQSLDPSGVLEFLARVIGLNCIIGGTAGGWVNGLTEDHVDLTLEVDHLNAVRGGGVGQCRLTPSEDCILRVTADGNL